MHGGFTIQQFIHIRVWFGVRNRTYSQLAWASLNGKSMTSCQLSKSSILTTVTLKSPVIDVSIPATPPSNSNTDPNLTQDIHVLRAEMERLRLDIIELRAAVEAAQVNDFLILD